MTAPASTADRVHDAFARSLNAGQVVAAWVKAGRPGGLPSLRLRLEAAARLDPLTVAVRALRRYGAKSLTAAAGDDAEVDGADDGLDLDDPAVVAALILAHRLDAVMAELDDPEQSSDPERAAGGAWLAPAAMAIIGATEYMRGRRDAVLDAVGADGLVMVETSGGETVCDECDAAAAAGPQPRETDWASYGEHVFGPGCGCELVEVSGESSRLASGGVADDIAPGTACISCKHPASMHQDTSRGENTGKCSAKVGSSSCSCSGTVVGAGGPADASDGAAWHAVLTLEGLLRDDSPGFRRGFRPGACSWRELPLSLMDSSSSAHGENDNAVIGRIDTIERVGDQIMATGVFSPTPEGAECARQIGVGEKRGISIDYVVAEYEVESQLADPLDPEQGMVGQVWATQALILGARVVPEPPFSGAVIALADQPLPEAPALVASLRPLDDERPPAAWFENPHLDGPTHLSVDDAGRVTGHLATWDTPHIGYAARTVAPHSASGYAHFATGSTRCADGSRVRTGPLSLGCGHASGRLSARAAAEHYDNAGTAVADVSAGEDEHGIWLAGALRPGVTAAQVRALDSGDVSGDWREIGGELELVAALAVNVAGFPVRAVAGGAGDVLVLPTEAMRAYMVEDRQVSLVAAGIYHCDPVGEALRSMAKRVGQVETVCASLRARQARGRMTRAGISAVHGRDDVNKASHS